MKNFVQRAPKKLRTARSSDVVVGPRIDRSIWWTVEGVHRNTSELHQSQCHICRSGANSTCPLSTRAVTFRKCAFVVTSCWSTAMARCFLPVCAFCKLSYRETSNWLIIFSPFFFRSFTDPQLCRIPLVFHLWLRFTQAKPFTMIVGLVLFVAVTLYCTVYSIFLYCMHFAIYFYQSYMHNVMIVVHVCSYILWNNLLILAFWLHQQTSLFEHYYI